MYSSAELPLQEKLIQDMLKELEPLKQHSSALAKLYGKNSDRDGAASSTFGLSDREPEGILNHAVIALSTLSKEAGASGPGRFGGSSGTALEEKRKECLAAFKTVLQMHKTAASQQRQEFARLEKELKEKNQVLKEKDQVDQENARLKEELRQIKAELEKSAAVKTATDQTMNIMSTQFASQFSQLSTHLSSVLASTVGTSAMPSALGSIVEDELPAVDLGSSTGSVVAASIPKPSANSQAARGDIGNELVRLLKYLDASRLFLLFVLSDIFYPENSGRLAGAITSLSSQSSSDPKIQTLLTCLVDYQSKLPSATLPDSERSTLKTKLVPVIRDLYTRERKVSVLSAVQQLEAIKQSNEAPPGQHKATNVFYKNMIPAICELQKAGKLSEAPFPPEMKDPAFATKFAALYQQKIAVLPPVDSNAEFKKDFENFKKVARQSTMATSATSRSTTTVIRRTATGK